MQNYKVKTDYKLHHKYANDTLGAYRSRRCLPDNHNTNFRYPKTYQKYTKIP